MLHPLLKKNQTKKQIKQRNPPHTTPQQLFFIRYLRSCCRDPFVSLCRALPSRFSAFFPAPKSPAPGNPCNFSPGLMTRDKGRRARFLRSKRQQWHQKQAAAVLPCPNLAPGPGTSTHAACRPLLTGAAGQACARSCRSNH